jgi:hypothetical protein
VTPATLSRSNEPSAKEGVHEVNQETPGDAGETAADEPYEPPVVIELGTIEEMTRGFASAPGDDLVTGSTTTPS